MNLIAYILNRRIIPHDQRLAKVWLNTLSVDGSAKIRQACWYDQSLPFCIYSHQAEFLPASLDNVLHSEVKFAGHDSCVGLARELVEEVKADAINLVVYVQAIEVAIS